MMRVALDPAFTERPIAHRAYHDEMAGRPENSLAAIRAALMANYAIEIDVQPSADGVPMVFHDYDLERLTGAAGHVSERMASELQHLTLIHGDEGVPTLAQVLDTVSGRVPILIEVKDQDGAMGPKVGPLERAVAQDLRGYRGPVAVMSFNPHSVAAMAEAAPEVARGLTTSAYVPELWKGLPVAVCDRLRGIPDFDAVGASFISHEAPDLGRDRVAELKARGVPVLCWTIRSPKAEEVARRVADNVTFEGYPA